MTEHKTVRFNSIPKIIRIGIPVVIPTPPLPPPTPPPLPLDYADQCKPRTDLERKHMFRPWLSSESAVGLCRAYGHVYTDLLFQQLNIRIHKFAGRGGFVPYTYWKAFLHRMERRTVRLRSDLNIFIEFNIRTYNDLPDLLLLD